LTVLDSNILLYAWNRDDPNHEKIKPWLESLLRSQDWVGLPWITLWTFLRLTTNSRLYSSPLSPERAFEIISEWIQLPNVVIIEPGLLHPEILQRLVIEGQATGPLLSDAVLAALAMEQGATLASTDRDFSRFPGLSWINPLSPDPR
jgi:toxin-antitoxin system PIN domain toxin